MALDGGAAVGGIGAGRPAEPADDEQQRPPQEPSDDEHGRPPWEPFDGARAEEMGVGGGRGCGQPARAWMLGGEATSASSRRDGG